MQIVRGVLEIPAEFSGGGVERQHRIGIQVVAFALVAVVVGTRIAGGPEELVGFRIVGAGEPGGSASVRQRLAGPGFGERLARRGPRPEPPHALAGGSFVSRDEPANALIAAARA